LNRIQKVSMAIDYIEANLTEKIDLAAIAEAVHYSKFHLHREFRRAMGITLHDYLLRRRLTEAAKLLVFSSKPILAIALSTGYESQQAFTSVFTTMYKQSPAQYRENEEFYPLQLKCDFKGAYRMLRRDEKIDWEVAFAAEEDVPCWMNLARLVVDGFPHWNEAEYIRVLKQRIATRQALILKDDDTAVGIMLFSYQNGSIDFLAVHPCYRQQGLAGDLLARAIAELLEHPQISITTFREGDQADTGHRAAVKALGFAEAELLTEFGYPTQKMILAVEEKHD